MNVFSRGSVSFTRVGIALYIMFVCVGDLIIQVGMLLSMFGALELFALGMEQVMRFNIVAVFVVITFNPIVTGNGQRTVDDQSGPHQRQPKPCRLLIQGITRPEVHVLPLHCMKPLFISYFDFGSAA